MNPLPLTGIRWARGPGIAVTQNYIVWARGPSFNRVDHIIRWARTA